VEAKQRAAGGQQGKKIVSWQTVGWIAGAVPGARAFVLSPAKRRRQEGVERLRFTGGASRRRRVRTASPRGQ